MASGTDGNLTWDLDESTGVLTISGTGEMTNYTDSSQVPWYSYKESSIKSVVIEEGVTRIGTNCFRGCTLLQSVTMPNSVRTISYYSFLGCNALKSITIPKNVKNIDSYAFHTCTSLKSISFLGNQPTMWGEAFNLGGSSTSSISVTATVYTTGWGSDSVFTSTVKGSNTTFIYKTLPGIYSNMNGTWKKVA